MTALTHTPPATSAPDGTTASTTTQLQAVVAKLPSPAAGVVTGSWKLRQGPSPLETRHVAS